ncbi:MAG: hypothetical protein F9B45_17365 [Phycisphaera sp. RhM]|nr:hypothetical protein [Phycisphaera sp. RhM]
MNSTTGITSRRRFAFWLGFGMLSLGERIRVGALDDLTAVSTSIAGSDGIDLLPIHPGPSDGVVRESLAEHWSIGHNASWRWYERENLVRGVWKTTGVTLPIDRETGKAYTGQTGYLDESLVPDVILIPADRKRLKRPLVAIDSWQDRQVAIKPSLDDLAFEIQDPETMPIEFGDRSQRDAGRSSEERRGRHGRPPSEWLRSLTTREIRIWLAKVEIQEALVSGMTFRTHLTRDHLFDSDRIAGLTDAELAELHGAAHAGF